MAIDSLGIEAVLWGEAGVSEPKLATIKRETERRHNGEK
jgi:hypothetical protein